MSVFLSFECEKRTGSDEKRSVQKQSLELGTAASELCQVLQDFMKAD